MEEQEAIIAAEGALRSAMVAGDVAALDELLDDGLCFTDQHGNRLSKHDDLGAHRSGLLQIAAIEPVGLPEIRLFSDIALVCLTVDLAGQYDGAAFSGRFSYSRVWSRQQGKWRVVLAHCSALPSTG